MARRSLEERSVARAARREAAEDPSGNRKLSRFAQCLFLELPPLVALLESGLAVRKEIGPLSVEERQELEDFAAAAKLDPRVVAYLEQLKIPAAERIQKAADLATFQQIQTSYGSANERVKLVNRQDSMNRGGHPATTVQRTESGGVEKLGPRETAEELRREAEELDRLAREEAASAGEVH